MVMALISLISVSLAPETYLRDLKHIQDENRAVLQARPHAEIVADIGKAV
jgi:hypothetical protein